MKEKKFSTIEMTVLGLTWLRGPCTTYAVMKELSSSASTYHKSRAGTAYSVVNRLVRLGLIEELDSQQIRVSDLGEAEVRKWVGPDVPTMDLAHSADLVRLRFFFLEALPPVQRLEFIDRSITGLESFGTRCRDLIGKNEEIGDYYGALATASIVLETEARIQWLKMVRKFVEQPLPEGTDWTQEILAAIDARVRG